MNDVDVCDEVCDGDGDDEEEEVVCVRIMMFVCDV